MLFILNSLFFPLLNYTNISNRPKPVNNALLKIISVAYTFSFSVFLVSLMRCYSVLFFKLRSP